MVTLIGSKTYVFLTGSEPALNSSPYQRLEMLSSLKKDMTSGKEWKQILFFTLPIVAGNLLQQLYNTVDGIIVGQFVSEGAFSGVATCAPLAFFFLAFAMGLSIGVGIVVAQYFGAGKHDKLPVSIDTALMLLGACGLLLTVIGLIIAPIMLRAVLSVPENVMPFALTYFRIYLLGLFFQFVYNGIAAILRGLGDSRAILFFLIIATVLNTILDLIFVVTLKWSVAGAAIATVIAQFVCVLVSYRYMRKRFPFIKSGKHWDGEICTVMTKLGLPIAIQQSVVSFGHGAMQRLVNNFDLTVPGVMAAYGAGVRMNNFIYVPILSFQSGLASFTGQNIGAGRLDRVYRGYRMTLIMSLLVTIVMCTLLYIFAGPVVTVFGLADDALLRGIEQIRFLTKFFWMFSAYITLAGLLQGAGDTVLQSITTLSALGTQIIAAYTLVHFGLLGYSAAWTTTPIGWAVAMIISHTRFFTGGWKKKAVAGKLSREKLGVSEE